jgi:hypothetical protein
MRYVFPFILILIAFALIKTLGGTFLSLSSIACIIFALIFLRQLREF